MMRLAVARALLYVYMYSGLLGYWVLAFEMWDFALMWQLLQSMFAPVVLAIEE